MAEAKEKGFVLVTGGTSGVGFECAKVLVQQGHEVLITGRSKAQGELIAAQIGAKFAELELGSQHSIREFVNRLGDYSHKPFHTLICNAGLQVYSITKTAEGLETTFAVNHLGHFLLTHLLLKRSLHRPARIVVVASGTHDPAQHTPVEPPRFSTAENVSRGILTGPPLSNFKQGHCAYSTSKLCNILFAYELHRRLEREGIHDVKVNAFDPGLTPGTNLARNAGLLFHVFKCIPVWLLKRMVRNTHTVDESGTSLAVLATAPEFAEVSGKYFEHEDFTPFAKESSVDSYSLQFAEDLWQESVKLSDLSAEESILPL